MQNHCRGDLSLRPLQGLDVGLMQQGAEPMTSSLLTGEWDRETLHIFSLTTSQLLGNGDLDLTSWQRKASLPCHQVTVLRRLS